MNFLRATLWAQGAAVAWVVLRPDLWLPGLLLGLSGHLALVAASLWPRAALLGANLSRLPAAAAARNEVAITLDDGPDPEVTPQVLAILAERGVHATFFCIGERAGRHPELCRAMIAAGHEIANHGQRHPHSLALRGLRFWHQEISAAQQALTQISGQSPAFYRPVAGLGSVFMHPILRRLDLRLASWTRRGFDTRNADAAQVLARLTDRLAAGDILLLHDGHAARTAQGRAVVIDVLPRLLDKIAACQLTPVTLSAACKLN